MAKARMTTTEEEEKGEKEGGTSGSMALACVVSEEVGGGEEVGGEVRGTKKGKTTLATHPEDEVVTLHHVAFVCFVVVAVVACCLCQKTQRQHSAEMPPPLSSSPQLQHTKHKAQKTASFSLAFTFQTPRLVGAIQYARVFVSFFRAFVRPIKQNSSFLTPPSIYFRRRLSPSGKETARQPLDRRLRMLPWSLPLGVWITDR